MTNARKIIASLLIVVAGSAVAIGGASGAFSPKQERFSEGAPQVGSSVSGPILTIPQLAPGGRTRKTVTVSNTGAASGRYGLTTETSGSAKLADRLRVTISTKRGQRLYDGSLSRLGSLTLGTLAPGARLTLVFQVRFPSSGHNVMQGHTVDAAFTWSATSA